MNKDQTVSEKNTQNLPTKDNVKTKQPEINGYKGQEPTKYGDWQHKGKVTDF